MTTPRDTPSYSSEVFLDRREIEAFRDVEVWPAIDHLARFDFVDEAAIGSEMHHSLMLPRPYGTKIVQVDSRIWTPDDEWGDIKIRHCSAEIRIERTCQDIAQQTYICCGRSGR